MTTNYLKEVDLAAPTLPPGNQVNNPYDPRAHHDFCFESDSQTVMLVFPPQTAGTTPYRVFVSYDCGHLELIQPGPPPPPMPGTGPKIHAVLQYDPAFGPPSQQPEEYRIYRSPSCCSRRCHLKVWLDPMAPPPPTGTSIVVRVMASRESEAPSCGCSS